MKFKVRKTQTDTLLIMQPFEIQHTENPLKVDPVPTAPMEPTTTYAQCLTERVYDTYDNFTRNPHKKTKYMCMIVGFLVLISGGVLYVDMRDNAKDIEIMKSDIDIINKDMDNPNGDYLSALDLHKKYDSLSDGVEELKEEHMKNNDKMTSLESSVTELQNAIPDEVQLSRLPEEDTNRYNERIYSLENIMNHILSHIDNIGQSLFSPTSSPTKQPTHVPSNEPTQKPTDLPSPAPTEKPSQSPSPAPTEKPKQCKIPITEIPKQPYEKEGADWRLSSDHDRNAVKNWKHFPIDPELNQVSATETPELYQNPWNQIQTQPFGQDVTTQEDGWLYYHYGHRSPWRNGNIYNRDKMIFPTSHLGMNVVIIGLYVTPIWNKACTGHYLCESHNTTFAFSTINCETGIEKNVVSGNTCCRSPGSSYTTFPIPSYCSNDDCDKILSGNGSLNTYKYLDDINPNGDTIYVAPNEYLALRCNNDAYWGTCSVQFKVKYITAVPTPTPTWQGDRRWLRVR